MPVVPFQQKGRDQLRVGLNCAGHRSLSPSIFLVASVRRGSSIVNQMKKNAPGFSSAKGGRKRRGPQRLAALSRSLLAPSLKKRGFHRDDILKNWRNIVGDQLAEECIPEKIVGSRGNGDASVLWIRVESARALEIQYLSPQILQRINTYYGREFVREIRLKQGPVFDPLGRADRDHGVADQEIPNSVTQSTANIEHDRLRIALDRLGARTHKQNRF
jgi:hypothetical protein